MKPIFSTGLFSGDYIIGTNSSKGNNLNEGTVIQVRFPKNEYFPCSRDSIDKSFIKKLTYGFLSTIDPDKRSKFLKDHSSNEEIYLSDLKLELRFITLSGIFENLEIASELNEDNWVDMEYVYDKIPGGAKTSRRHSLIFRPSIWALYNLPEDVPNTYYDLINCCFREERVLKQLCVIRIGKKKIGLCDEKKCKNFEIDDNISKNFSWFTPAVYKSLIQKCIRFFSEKTNINGETHDTLDVLRTAFFCLMIHPGSFVPDIKKFVKGSESALKRFAVSILEDSYLEKDYIECLLFAALAARKGFKFSLRFLNNCSKWLELSLNERYYVYDFEDEFVKGRKSDKLIIKTLEELHSLSGDFIMLKSISRNEWKFRTKKNCIRNEMDIFHCLDHHCTTNVIHFYDNSENKSIKEIINEMWEESSKFNPRKHKFELSGKIQNAKRLYWLLKSSNSEIKESKTNSSIIYQKNIDPSWISGIIGPIKNESKKNKVISFFDPENLSNVVTIRPPTRAKDQKELSNKELKYCENNIKELKADKFKISEPAILLNHKMKYENDEFYIYENREKKRWIDFCNSDETIPVKKINTLNTFDKIVERISSKNYSNVVSENYILQIKQILNGKSRKEILRIAMYLRVVSTNIELYKISRDGSGVYESVDKEDISVFQFLVNCCYYIPAVIKICKSNESTSISFDITNIFLWEKIKELVSSYLSEIKLFNWRIEKKDDRTLKDYQEESCVKIIDRAKFGKFGNIMWLPVGTGKTLIVAETFYRLSQMEMLCKYVIYTLPPETIKSVKKEFKRFGFKCKMVENSEDIEKFRINFVKHDHLRRKDIKKFITENSQKIFFVFDEFHKMMAIETQRSSIALEVSKLSFNFIAMTGTLIKDKDPKGLIKWMSEIVKYKLDTRNYLTAVALLISRKIDLGIEINRVIKKLKIDNEEYYSCVSSKFGGTSDEVNFRRAVALCYEVTQNGIIKQAKKVLKRERYVFIVALNKTMQKYIADKLLEFDIKSFCISSNNSILLTPDMMNEPYSAIITTMTFSTGYTLTACKTMITGVFFSSQATRTQLEGRIVRTGQPSKTVDIYIIMCGILEYTFEHYEEARSIEKALSDLSKEV